MTIDFVLPELVSVPFHNMDWWQGVETVGVLKADKTGLTVEFQTTTYTESLWPEVKSKSSVKEIVVPLDEIESVALKQGWVETMIELKARSLKTLSDLHDHHQGQVALCIAGKAKAKAQELVSTMAVVLSEHELRKLRPDTDE